MTRQRIRVVVDPFSMGQGTSQADIQLLLNYSNLLYLFICLV